MKKHDFGTWFLLCGLLFLFAPLLSPTANLSDTNFEIALGNPIDDIVSNNAYI